MSTNIPQVAINDIGDEQAFLEAVEQTIKVFNDGDLVSGQVVKIDHEDRRRHPLPRAVHQARHRPL